MQLKTRENCPLCNSKNIHPFKTPTFDPETIDPGNFKITDHHYGKIWPLSKCNSCSYVFSNPFLPAENLSKLYSHMKDPDYCDETKGRSKSFKTLLNRLAKLNPGKKLLDIGAAGGIFLHLAQKNGFDVHGIEASTFLVDQAKTLFDIDLFQGDMMDFPTGKKYDVITLLDFIEHIPEPAACLKKVDELLEKSGILVVVTPDIESKTARIMGKHWWHFRIAHVGYFSLTSLENLLSQYGFIIIYKKKYRWNFSLHYILTRLFQNLKNKKSLQKFLKRVHLILPLSDSWEIYARRYEDKS